MGLLRVPVLYVCSFVCKSKYMLVFGRKFLKENSIFC